MTWIVDNSNLLSVVLLTVIAISLIVVIGHLRTLIEETAFIAKLYEHNPPLKTAEAIQEIRDEVASISTRIDKIDLNTSD